MLGQIIPIIDITKKNKILREKIVQYRISKSQKILRRLILNI